MSTIVPKHEAEFLQIEAGLPEVSYSEQPRPGMIQPHAQQGLASHCDHAFQDSKVFGIQRRTFWFVVVMASVVVAAAIGGGVGGGALARNKKPHTESIAQQAPPVTITAAPTEIQSSPSSTTPLPTSTTIESTESVYTPKPPTDVIYVNKTCPSSLQIMSAKGNIKFDCVENTDSPGSDVATLVAYTLELCIESCYLMNQVGDKEKLCVGVGFAEKLRERYMEFGGNCYLKYELSAIEKDHFHSTLVRLN